MRALEQKGLFDPISREFAFIVSSFKALGLIVATRWRTVRSFRVRVAFAVALYVLTIIAGFAMNSGVLFAELATYADSEEASLARAWLADVAVGDYSLLGISFVATGFGVALLAPFTGAGLLTLIDDDSAMPFAFPRGRRFLDSVAFASISGVGVVHFLVAVLSASLLTVDGSRLAGIALAMILWLSFLALASTVGWTAEIATGLYGKKVKWIYGAVLASVGVSFYLNSEFQTVLSDAAGLYGKWVRLAAVPNSMVEAVLAFLLALALLAVIVVGGLHLARYWDNLPPQFKQVGLSARSVTKNSRARAGLSVLLVHTLWRTREVRRTIVAVTIAGSVSASFFFDTAPESILTGIMIGVPAISVLIWPANAFGPFGSGITWLFSQPKAKSKIVTNALVAAIAQSILMMCVLTLPILILHAATLQGISWYVWTSGLFNSVLLSIIALLLSILNPFTVRLAGKGESILPPAAAIGYLIGFGTLSGLSYLSLSAFISINPLMFWVYMFIWLVLSASLIMLVRAAWSEPLRQRRVLFTAAGD